MNSDQLQVSAKIVSIKLISFSIDPSKEKQGKKIIDKNTLTFEYNLNIKQEQSIQIIDCKIHIFADSAKKIYLGELISTGTFEIVNYEELVMKINGVPKSIVAMFLGVLISTNRGFLICKSENTILENIMLPMVNPETLWDTLNKAKKLK